MYFCVLCIVCFVSFSVLFVCIRVLNYCHRMATQLQLNISYHIIVAMLLCGQSGVPFLAGTRDFPLPKRVQTGPGAYPATSLLGAGGSFPRVWNIRGAKSNTHLHLVQRVTVSGATYALTPTQTAWLHVYTQIGLWNHDVSVSARTPRLLNQLTDLHATRGHFVCTF
jgi:hypothetical protein